MLQSIRAALAQGIKPLATTSAGNSTDGNGMQGGEGFSRQQHKKPDLKVVSNEEIIKAAQVKAAAADQTPDPSHPPSPMAAAETAAHPANPHSLQRSPEPPATESLKSESKSGIMSGPKSIASAFVQLMNVISRAPKLGLKGLETYRDSKKKQQKGKIRAGTLMDFKAE